MDLPAITWIKIRGIIVTDPGTDIHHHPTAFVVVDLHSTDVTT